jgi:hypothetical protein
MDGIGDISIAERLAQETIGAAGSGHVVPGYQQNGQLR